MSKNITVTDVQLAFDKFLLLADRDVVRLMLAVVIGNQMTKRFPIWVMMVAPPSSGKTTLLNSLLGLCLTNKDGEMNEIIHSISDLTVNSFASGMSRSETETSLLHRMKYGDMMVFKDFTSILSKHKDEKKIVMGQLREIYDGAYKKMTGNAKTVDWTGKVGAFAGVTQSVYQHLEEFSVMGDRFMFYQIPQPDRKEMLKFKIRQEREGRNEIEMMPEAKELVHSYIQRAFDNMEDVPVLMDEETENEIIDVADFCTMVRSGIIINEYNNMIKFVPAPEMPARMFDQMMGIASAFALMRKLDNPSAKEESYQLKQEDFKLMYKIAYDSIPIVRRIALRYLTEYKNGVDTTALATKINYPSEVVRTWLEQLNALGVVKRVKRGGGQNYWTLDEKYRHVMVKLQNIKVIDDFLLEDDGDAVEQAWEADRHRPILTEDEIREMEQNEDF